MKAFIGAVIILVLVAAFSGVVVYRAIVNGRTGCPHSEIDELTQAVQNYKENQITFPPCMLNSEPDRKDRFMEHVGKAFPNFDTRVAETFDALNRKVQEDWKYNFPHSGAVLIPLNLETLDPAETLVFWLGGFPTPIDPATKHPVAERRLFGFHRDSDMPFKRDVPGVESLEPLRYRTEPLFGFDETRLVDHDHDGWLEYSSGWSEDSKPLPPWVYFDGVTYSATTNSRDRLGTCLYPNDRALAAVFGTAVPYLLSFIPGRPETSTWAKDTGFQIICSGLDGLYGPRGEGAAMPAARLSVFPMNRTFTADDGFRVSQEFDETELDNLTNLSTRPIGEAAK